MGFIFLHTINLVYSGQKGQTSRPPKAGEYYDPARQAVCHASGVIKWAVGRDYAIQAGRGLKGQGRLRITHIEPTLQDVRNFTKEDAEREGFPNLYEFWLVWCGMYDKVGAKNLVDYDGEWVGDHREFLKSRPGKIYQAWVIRFELVENVIQLPTVTATFALNQPYHCPECNQQYQTIDDALDCHLSRFAYPWRGVFVVDGIVTISAHKDYPSATEWANEHSGKVYFRGITNGQCWDDDKVGAISHQQISRFMLPPAYHIKAEDEAVEVIRQWKGHRL